MVGSLVVVACGGGDEEVTVKSEPTTAESTPDTEAPEPTEPINNATLADWMAAADEICGEAEAAGEGITDKLIAAATIEDAALVLEQEFVPAFERQIADLEAIELPGGDKDRQQVEELIAALKDSSNTIASDPLGALQSDDDPMARPDAIAKELGFAVCGSHNDEPADEPVATDPPVEDTEPGTFGDNEQASVIAGLLAQQFSESDETFVATADDEQCIADQLSTIYTEDSLAALADGSIAFEDLTTDDQTNVLLAVEECVPTEVIAGYVTEGILEELPGMSQEQGDCISTEVINTYGVAGLVQLGQLTADEQDTDTIIQVFQLMQTCMTNAELGLLLAPSILEDSPNLDEEQAACFMTGMLDDVGIEALAAFDDPDFVPSPEMEQALIDLIFGCGIDPADL